MCQNKVQVEVEVQSIGGILYRKFFHFFHVNFFNTNVCQLIQLSTVCQLLIRKSYSITLL